MDALPAQGAQPPSRKGSDQKARPFPARLPCAVVLQHGGRQSAVLFAQLPGHAVVAQHRLGAGIGQRGADVPDVVVPQPADAARPRLLRQGTQRVGVVGVRLRPGQRFSAQSGQVGGGAVPAVPGMVVQRVQRTVGGQPVRHRQPVVQVQPRQGRAQQQGVAVVGGQQPPQARVPLLHIRIHRLHRNPRHGFQLLPGLGVQGWMDVEAALPLGIEGRRRAGVVQGAPQQGRLVGRKGKGDEAALRAGDIGHAPANRKDVFRCHALRHPGASGPAAQPPLPPPRAHDHAPQPQPQSQALVDAAHPAAQHPPLPALPGRLDHPHEIGCAPFPREGLQVDLRLVEPSGGKGIHRRQGRRLPAAPGWVVHQQGIALQQ